MNREFLKAAAFSGIVYSLGIAFVLFTTPNDTAALPYVSGVVVGAVMRTIFLRIVGR